MTEIELIEYLIKECLGYLVANKCPLDKVCAVCSNQASGKGCGVCWKDFLENRYKNVKVGE